MTNTYTPDQLAHAERLRAYYQAWLWSGLFPEHVQEAELAVRVETCQRMLDGERVNSLELWHAMEAAQTLQHQFYTHIVARGRLLAGPARAERN